ncbi:baseplate J/gp47 family protein [Vibrio fluvialis]|nr:baseplate J/gp47 family protein [Vibrio fluvialis]
MSVQDLSLLSPPELLETLDYEQIFEEMRLRLISLDPTYSALVESDPAYKILEVAAYFRLIDRQRINDAAVATMLAYAQKADLDNIGARYNVERQVITPEDTSTVPPTEAVMEPDDDFRLRIQLRLEGMSVAGPVNAYKYHALSAHAQVADVTAISPNPGEVLVTVLSREGNGTASNDVLTAVRTALNAEYVRPLTDAVTVQSATITNYQIDAVLYMPPGPEYEATMAAANTRIAEYTNEQLRLGRNIRRSAIDAALHVSGVQNVKVISPDADIVLDKTKAGYCTSIALSYGGEDE